MTVRHQIELDGASFLVAGAIFGIFFAVYLNRIPKMRSSFAIPVVQDTPSPTPSPTLSPSPVPLFIPATETSSQVSPDGTKKLTMTITTTRNGNKTYAFTASDADNTNQNLIYSVSLPPTESMTIPYNTWSPDNAYVFLAQSTQAGGSALVMRANGQTLSDGQQFDNVTELFTARNTGNTYQETTGWASETLLIINTKNPDGSKGPSYWFEVPSKAIIQLSTVF
jgi:hypothetical protein